MTTKRIYIAGKKDGVDRTAIRIKFETAAKKLRKEYSHDFVFDPFAHIEECIKQIKVYGSAPLMNENNRKTILGICIEMLLTCDAIYLLPDWQHSEDAMLEAMIARMFGYEIINSQSVRTAGLPYSF
ncbi:MAG: DUF4406 domain-containing protein [Chitinophagaceae bacterium]